MTIVGEAFIEISPTDKGFEGKVVATANAAAKKAAGALVIPAKADADQLDASVVAAAKAAAKKAARELADIPGGVDAETFTAKVQAAAAEGARKAATKLANIPAGLDVAGLETEAANAAARAATSAGGKLDGIPMGVDGAELVRDVDAAMDKAERRVDAGARKMRADTGGALDGLGGVVARGFAAVGVGQLVFGGIQEQREAQAAARQTEAVIRSTGGAANVTGTELGKLAKNLQAKTAVEDDAIRVGANLLLTFTNVRNEAGKGNDVFNQATGVLVDMAAAMGTDVSSGAIQLGKALNDPIAGVSALAEVGVTFTDQQKEQIRTMVEAGDTAKAQQIILAELRKEFGGSAAAQADDLDRLGNKYDAFREKVGAMALGVAGALGSIPGPLLAVGAGLGGLAVVAVGVSKVADAVGGLTEHARALGAAHPAMARSLGQLGLLGAAAGGAFALGKGVVAIVDAVGRLDDVRVDVPDLQAALAGKLDLSDALRSVDPRLMREYAAGFKNVADAAEGFGISFEKAARESTRGDLDKTLDDLDKSLAALVAGGAPDQARDRIEALAAELGRSPREVLLFLDDYREALGLSGAAAATSAAAAREAGDATDALGGATADTASSLDTEAEAADRAAKALDDFKGALDAALGVQINAERAAIDYVDSVQALRDQVTEAGKTLDLNSEAGRRNREAILSVVDGARQHIEAMADEGATAGELNRTWQTHRGELALVLSQLGFTKAEASTYLGLLDKVPETVFTDLSVRDEVAAAKVRSFAKLLNDQLGTERIVTIKLNPVTGKLETRTGPELREHGGPVYRGRGYVVGEKRPEWFVPDTNGWVYPTVPKAANGAVVQPTPGGTLVQVAEAGRAEAIMPLPPGLVAALERLAASGGAPVVSGNLVVQGATVADSYATGMETVRQLRALQGRGGR